MGGKGKPSGWRALGRLVNSGVGRFVLERDAGLVAGMMSVAMGADLEEQVPWTPLRRPVRECTVALVTTAGVYRPDQAPFDVDAVTGDPSFRMIPGDQDLGELRVAHTHYPTDRARRDPNVVFPLQRLREAEAEGGIGRVARRHASFGFCARTRALIATPGGSAHELARLLVADEVDLALLVPA